MATTAAAPVVEVDRLSRLFGPRRAVDGVSLTVARGEVVGLLGPNGAGKTTTMRMLAGVLAASSGTVRIAGIELERDSIAARRRVGYLPEQVAPYHEMTVSSYLRFFARLRGVPRRETKAMVSRAVDETGLGDVRRRVIGGLSRGYRQRLGLANALVHEPPVLVMDEPTSSLDPRQVAEVRDLIARLGRSRAVVLSTHILTEATRLCDRVVILSRGEVVAEGAPDDLARRAKGGRSLRLKVRAPQTEVVAVVRGIAGIRDVSASVEAGVVALRIDADRDVAAEVARVIADRWELLELAEEKAALEQVFLALTT